MPLPSRIIKLELLRAGIAHAAIAEAAHVSPSLVSHVIKGRRRHEIVEREIARAIGFSEDEVFGPPLERWAEAG